MSDSVLSVQTTPALTSRLQLSYSIFIQKICLGMLYYLLTYTRFFMLVVTSYGTQEFWILRYLVVWWESQL